MEHASWTDERLDDLARRVDAGFDRVDSDIRELRTAMLGVGGAMMAGLIGVIAAVLATA
jgi:hypothetical protein